MDCNEYNKRDCSSLVYLLPTIMIDPSIKKLSIPLLHDADTELQPRSVAIQNPIARKPLGNSRSAHNVMLHQSADRILDVSSNAKFSRNAVSVAEIRRQYPGPGDDEKRPSFISEQTKIIKYAVTSLVMGNGFKSRRSTYAPQRKTEMKAEDETIAPLGTVLTCMIDGDSFLSTETPHFYCPRDPSHSLCVTCFADYVTFCCDSWATQNTIPIKCQIPECGYLIPERTIMRLLGCKQVSARNLEERYMKTQMKAALASTPADAKDLPVTCAYCGDYSVFYSQTSNDQWQSIAKQRLKAEEEVQYQIFEKVKELRADIQRLLQEEEKISLLTPEQRLLKLDELEAQNEMKLGRIEEEILKDQASKTLQGELMSNDSTSLLFVCRKLFCDGAYCLACKTFFKKEDLLTHNCNDSAMESLYQQVIETLTASSTRSCPNCGTSGMKDLACTHITCDKCSHKFCYVCGKSESEVQGGFEMHNRWLGVTPWEGSTTCPLYLHDYWGNGESGELALENFHRELQIRALDELKKKFNNDMLWADMIDKKFGGKPLVEPPQKLDAPFLYDPAIPTPVERFLEQVFPIVFLFYILFFLAMYCWMIHAGRTSLGQGVSSKLEILRV
jgi:hypothetical protein